MSKVCELIIYTANAALTFNVVATSSDFQERLAAALEEGTVVLDTTEDSRLILNAINVVAIEVHKETAAEKMSSDTPPVENI